MADVGGGETKSTDLKDTPELTTPTDQQPNAEKSAASPALSPNKCTPSQEHIQQSECLYILYLFLFILTKGSGNTSLGCQFICFFVHHSFVMI